jgi:hypothetical protein
MKEYIVKVHFSIMAADKSAAREAIVDTLQAYPELLDEIPGLLCSCVDDESEIMPGIHQLETEPDGVAINPLTGRPETR